MKTKFAFYFLIVLNLFVVDQSPAQCLANEMTGLSVSKDNNCESVEFWNYNQVNITVIRNFQKQGKFKFKLRKTGSASWINPPINFYIDTINGVLYTNEFHYVDNGEFRCIFYESGTGCKDTLYTTITVNKAPKPGTSFAYTCYGGLFKFSDARNPSGVGNTYEVDNGGIWVPTANTIPVTCNNCVWIVPVGGPAVKITNSLGCSATTYWVGSIFNDFPPTYSISASQNPIGSGQSTLLTASSNYAVSNYKWYKTGSSSVLGTDSIFSVSYPDTGKYKVRIRNTNAAGACVVNKFITIYGPSGARMDEMTYNDDLMVYPNPANGLLHISGHEGKVDILDMHGRYLYSQSNIEPVFTMDISHLSSGLYLIKSGDKVMKLMKE